MLVSYFNDICVLARVRPICLPYSSDLLQDWESIKLRVVGWGLMSKLDDTPQILATKLMSVEVHVRERSYCDQFHTRQYGKLDEKRVICTSETYIFNSGHNLWIIHLFSVLCRRREWLRLLQAGFIKFL